MENIFQNLFAPQITICGIHLERYTLWNHLLLQAFDSPFLPASRNQRFGADDLLLAAYLCSTPTLERPDLRSRPLRNSYWLRRLRKPSVLLKSARDFAGWVDSHILGPEFWRDSNKAGEDISSPETFALAYGLTSRAGLGEHDAWSKSPGVAQAILATCAELNGSAIRFFDPSDVIPDEQPAITDREELYKTALRDLGKDRADELLDRFDRDQSIPKD